MEVPEVILYMDYNMTLACYPWSLLIYYLLTFYTPGSPRKPMPTEGDTSIEGIP
jgi:hypothetical protein